MEYFGRDHNRFGRMLGLVVVGGLLLAACSAATKLPTAQATAQPQVLPTSTPLPAGEEQGAGTNAVAIQAREALSALLKVDVSFVTVSTVEAVQWASTCLGVEIPGQTCAMHAVDGYRVLLEADGQRYEYHTNVDGSVLLPALVLTWHREGGIAGFCDDLVINVVGEAAAGSCRGVPPAEEGLTLLREQHREELGRWLSTLRPFTVEYEDAAVADAMITRLVFSGWGTAEANNVQKQAVGAFAAELYAEMSRNN